MDVADRSLAPMEEDLTKAEDESEDNSLPERPVHDVLYVTDSPTKSLRSGRGRDGAGGWSPQRQARRASGGYVLRGKARLSPNRVLCRITGGRSSLAIA